MNSYSELIQNTENYRRNYVKHNNSTYQHPHVQSQECNCCSAEEKQRHVHEFEGSTKLAEEGEERHNHRFAGVSGQAIPLFGGSHKHIVSSNTDFFDHFHVINDETGPAIEVGDGKHVHFVKGMTTINDGHFHVFTFATLIQSPLLPAEG